MSREPVTDVMKGFLPDPADVVLPDGAFSDSRNFRYRDQAIEKCKGQTACFGSLSVTPMCASAIGNGVTSFWVYANDSVVYGTDGTTHSLISSTTSYAFSPDLGFTGGQYHGYQVLTDGAVAPVSWQPNLGNVLTTLPAWPAGLLCQVIRPFQDYLVALRCQEGSTFNPRLLRWSDIGGVGALPQSWDYTDPTVFAGRTELGQTQDYLVDCLPLRGVNIVYKQYSTYLMLPISGTDAFEFQLAFSTAGLLAENCAAAFGANHFCVTADDIIVHDGANVNSIADKRVRDWFFNALNAQRYQRTFVVPDFFNHTMWVCFCEAGNDYPNLALCWDWSNDNWFVRELGANMSTGGVGIVIGSELELDTQVGNFDAQSEEFDEEGFTPFSNRLVLFNSGKGEAYQAEQGQTFNGATMTCYAERSNIGLSQDLKSIKRVQRLFPKIYGTPGDVVQVYVGAKSAPDAAVSYQGPFNYTIGTSYKIDCRVSGRWINLKIQYQGTNAVKCAGFDVEFIQDGYR